MNEIVNNLVEEFNTADPFELAEIYNVIVVFEQFKDLKGVFVKTRNKRIIILDKRLKGYERLHVAAHELYHALFHFYRLMEYKRDEKVKEQFENEANEFAEILLERIGVYE